MLLITDEHAELDEELLSSVAQKASDGKLDRDDMRDSFRLFCQVCNRVDELRFELKDLTQSYRLEIGDRRCAVAFKSGACAVYEGDIESPDITMTMTAGIALDLLMGRMSSAAAHMNGDIAYKGTKNGALRLQAAFELFLDVLDSSARPDRSDAE